MIEPSMTEEPLGVLTCGMAGEGADKRQDGIEFVVVITPNYLHYPVAKAFLENDIHVACDKPIVLSTEEAEDMARIARERGWHVDRISPVA